MLMRPRAAGVIGLLVVSTWLTALPEPAAAQSANVVCVRRDPATQVCTLELSVALVGDPSTVSVEVAGGGGGARPTCDRGPHYNPDPERAHLKEVPCNHPQYGWYSRTFDCYFLRASNLPPEAPGVIIPDGHNPQDPGSVYEAMCFTPSHPDIPTDNYCFYCVPPDWNGPPQYVFLNSAPDGYGGTPDPVPGLLVSAINQLELQGPTIGTAPPSGEGAGLVRLPVWLWNEVNGNNWGTLSATAGPIAGISVTAEARATKIVWDMGDGGRVTCDEGVAWERGMNILDPPCGHQYERASRHQPNGVYEIAATTTWLLEWQTEGLPDEEGGEFELQATSTTTLRIDEVQVLVR
jgi:hypothetical protein